MESSRSHPQQMDIDETETTVMNTLESLGLRSHVLLLTAAEMFVEKLGLPEPSRKEKRAKKELIRFCRHWERIYAITDSIVIGDDTMGINTLL